MDEDIQRAKGAVGELAQNLEAKRKLEAEIERAKAFKQELDNKFAVLQKQTEAELAAKQVAFREKNKAKLAQLEADYQGKLKMAQKAQLEVDSRNQQKLLQYQQDMENLRIKQKTKYDADTSATRLENSKALRAKLGSVAGAALGTALVVAGIHELQDDESLELTEDPTDKLIENLRGPAAKILKLQKERDELLWQAFIYRRSIIIPGGDGSLAPQTPSPYEN